MKLGLNGWTIIHSDLENDIKIARAAGFEELELIAIKIYRYLIEHSAQDLVDCLKHNKIRPVSINSIENITFQNVVGYEIVKRQVEYLAELCNLIGCSYLVLVPGPRPAKISDDQIVEHSASVLREIADICRPNGLKLAFEFLGFAGCSVNRLEIAAEIIDRVDRDDVGLVIDAFHFHAGGSKLETIRRLGGEQVFLYHIDDAEDLPRQALRDENRLLPGDGVIPLSDITSEISGTGYRGVMSIELFRPEYWARNPLELAIDACARMKTFGVT